MTATAAKTARDTAFEETVSAAGKVLEAGLAAAGTDKALRRAAWARYGDVQDAAGAAYRAAQDAERASLEGSAIMTEQTSTATCKFPGCENAPEPAAAKPGRPPEYCADPRTTP